MATSRFEQPASDTANSARDPRGQNAAGATAAGSADPNPGAALGRLEQLLAEVVELGRYYLDLKRDSLTSWVSNLVLWAVAGLLAVLVLAAVLISAGVVLVLGLGQLLGELLGGRLWAGYLLTGGGLIALAGGGLWLGASLWRRSRYRQTVKKYAARQQAQRERFGHDLSQR